jgi:hypothetical protein
MIQIPPDHRLANRAVLAVCTVLDRAGAVADVIKNDYGEDLFVQTQLRDIVDNFHVLIQVKGRKLRPTKHGDYKIQIETDHLRRWVSHFSPVLVCIFDEVSGRIFAFSPQRIFSLWQLATTSRRSMSVTLRNNQIFNMTTARKYIWECRLEYFSKMLSWHEMGYMYAVSTNEQGDSQRNRSLSEANMIVFSFLRSINLFDDGPFHPEFTAGIENASVNMSRMNSRKNNDPDPLRLEHVFTLCILSFFDKIVNRVGMPVNLLEHSSYLAEVFFHKFHPEEWTRANNRVRSTVSAPSKPISGGHGGWPF